MLVKGLHCLCARRESSSARRASAFWPARSSRPLINAGRAASAPTASETERTVDFSRSSATAMFSEGKSIAARVRSFSKAACGERRRRDADLA